MNNCLFICLFCATPDFTDLKSIPFWLESPSPPNYCRVGCHSGFTHGTGTPSDVNIHLGIKESVCSEAENLPRCAVSRSWVENISLQIRNNLPMNPCRLIQMFAANAPVFPAKQCKRNEIPLYHICSQTFTGCDGICSSFSAVAERGRKGQGGCLQVWRWIQTVSRRARPSEGAADFSCSPLSGPFFLMIL